ncbi:HlyD family secretion protein [Thermodesulforhabdus norvegica]|uniref:Membrane fusion protein, multidrug efflux system n=1 Tax=Thermodesulforhabdus norvegica TaxID=39841 RepID=A0A1I4UR57_9BACT|nr:HlyD family secretion protein [Thermodesulforhabdus norvegica]SFM91203.1 membrane fusion protein, multidrug efflux system [Thermodesulforhabdus norvegica]
MSSDMELKEGKNDRTAEAPEKRRVIAWLLLATILVASIGSFIWWYLHRHLETTDNAYVMADSATVSSRVPGRIAKIYVENDDYAEQGTVVVELESEDYRLRLEQAEAALKTLKAEYNLRLKELEYIDKKTQASVMEARAALEVARNRKQQAMDRVNRLLDEKRIAQADFNHARRDYERFEPLYRSKAIAERDFDRIRTAYKKARAKLDGVEAEISAAQKEVNVATDEIERSKAKLESALAERLQVDVQRRRLEALKAKIKEAEAVRDLAALNLSYCKIYAPISGYIAQKRIQVGDWVQPGQALFAIVPLKDVYIEANFKETQLTNMRIGQPAVIEADTYPGYEFHGRIVGIRAGTGAAFSLLPPENATGNWIKIVQRVPVKIRLDEPPPEDRPLRVGLSLKVTVDTSVKSGPFLKTARTGKPF